MTRNDSGLPTITVGLLCARDTDTVAVNEILYTITQQKYRPLELLICPDMMDDLTLRLILKQLYTLLPDGQIRTVIQPFSYEGGVADAVNWMIKNATGDFVIFHTLSETLYDDQVLLAYAQALQGTTAAMAAARTLVCRKADSAWKLLPHEAAYSQAAPAEVLCGGGICFRRAALEALSFSAGSYLEFLHAAISLANQDSVIKLPQLCATRHFCANFPENDDISLLYCTAAAKKERQTLLNLTDYLTLEAAVYAAEESCGRLFAPADNDKAAAIQHKIQHFCSSIRSTTQDSVWGTTDTQECLLTYLGMLCRLLDAPESRVSDYKWLLSKAKSNARNKFKIVFFVNEYATWPSLKSVYEAARNSPSMEAQIVYLPFSHIDKTESDDKALSDYRRAGYCPISHEQYDISRECPDIAVYVKPYDSVPPSFYIDETHKVIPHCLYIPYGMEVGNTAECLGYQCHTPMQYYAWRITAYCRDYMRKMQEHTFTQGQNYLPCGHPRVDLRLLDYRNDPTYTAIQQKAGDRKIVLWNTHFTLEDGDNWGSFFHFKNAVLDYFTAHDDIFLLWRPHPLFYGALAKIEHHNLAEIHAWFDALHERNNFYIDRGGDYLPAFAVSDAMISDLASFVPEYLAWGKPLLVTRKPGTTGTYLTALESKLVSTDRPADASAFLENIRTSKSAPPAVSPDIAEELYLNDGVSVGSWLIDYTEQQIRNERKAWLEED